MRLYPIASSRRGELAEMPQPRLYEVLGFFTLVVASGAFSPSILASIVGSILPLKS